MENSHDPYNVRAKLGLTAEALARIVGVNPSTVFRWDSAGERNSANRELMQMLAQAADAANDPRKLGHAMVQALTHRGRMAAIYLALHTIYWRTAPQARARKGARHA